MGSHTPSEESQTPNLDAYKSIIERGLDPHRQPTLFPTLVIETDDEISVAALNPAPEPQDTLEIVMQWKQAVVEDKESKQRHCIGFISHPVEITLVIFPPADGIWLTGRINATTGTVEWAQNAYSK